MVKIAKAGSHKVDNYCVTTFLLVLVISSCYQTDRLIAVQSSRNLVTVIV